MWILAGVCLIMGLEEPEITQAGTYDNAYAFYQTYENEMAFRPGASNQGEIYYATKGKKNVNAGIRYATVGWKVRVFNSAGALVETLYYQLGGKHMTSVNVCTVGGYEYCLYRVTLTNLKSRLSKAGRDALSSPNCNIVFDACITTRIKGKLQGGMTDTGSSWGKVYTTYNGIVHAEDWSSATKESLKSYYGKTVAGLFYNVTLTEGAGIRQVTGAGRYCFGTTVSVQAECEDGYHFSEWTGSKSSVNESFKFVLYGNDISLTAKAAENTYRIIFNANGGQGSISQKTCKYSDTMMLPADGVSIEGATLSGWKLSKEEGRMDFTTGQKISIKELVNRLKLQRKNGSAITLYAVWDYGPLIETETIYVSLKDAIEGRVTEEWLAKRALAHDREDGEIPYGKNKNTSFFMENYKASNFTKLQKEGCVTETFLAVDSAENRTRKEIEVYVIDTPIYPEEKVFGRVRFISKSYFSDKNGNLLGEELGGLAEDSIWRMEESYLKVLKNLFD